MELPHFVLMLQSVLCVFLLGSAFFCLKHKAASKIYWNFAKNIAASFMLLELSVLLILGERSFSFLIVAFHFSSVALSVMGGMMLARRLNRPSLPLILSLRRAQKNPNRGGAAVFVKTTLIASIFVCLFTFFLFRWTQPEVFPFFKEGLETHGRTSLKTLICPLSFFILVAFYEETVFRLFIQTFLNYLWRKFSWGSTAAILGSALLFAVGHFGILATWWVKFAQTFVLGLVLGIVMKKRGMEASFLVHAALNIFAVFSAGFLFR